MRAVREDFGTLVGDEKWGITEPSSELVTEEYHLLLGNTFFFFNFFDVHCFLKSLLNLLHYCFCFMLYFLAMRHVGAYLPNQG